MSRHCEGSVLLYRVMQGLVPVGTQAHRPSYHGTAWTLSSCTVLCKVSSLSGRWLIDRLITALRGLCPLVPCYARSRPCRDAGLSRHCADSVLLYRVMQGLVPVGTDCHFLFRPSGCSMSYPSLSSGGAMPYRWSGFAIQTIEYKDLQSATTMYCAKMARVAIKCQPLHYPTDDLT